MLQVRLDAERSVALLLTVLVALLAAYLVFARQSRAASSSSSTSIPPPPLVDNKLIPDAGNFRDNWLARRARYGSVHRVLEPHGVTIAYLGDVLAIKDVVDQPDRFDIGTLHIGSAPMWRISHETGAWFAHTGGQATVRHSSHLFSGARLATLQHRFVDALARQLDQVEAGTKEDLFSVVAECFFQATFEALFTKSFPRGQYGEFEVWDEELNQFSLGCASERAVKARDHFYRLVSQQVDEHLGECSLQVREQLAELEGKYAICHEDAVAIVLRTAWLGSTQSPLSGGWIVSLLARQPHKVARIREELNKLKAKDAGATASVEEIVKNPDLLKGENLPTLDNIVNELLRVYSAQNVPRTCLKDTVVRMLGPNNSMQHVQFKQGDILQLVYWNVHSAELNPHWWPEKEGVGNKYKGALEKFDETRFEQERRPGNAKVGGETVKTWTPFGFGARVCPGRFWAVAEIKATVLMFLDRFDVTEAGEMPRPDPKYWLGVLTPQDPMPATITLRS